MAYAPLCHLVCKSYLSIYLLDRASILHYWYLNNFFQFQIQAFVLCFYSIRGMFLPYSILSISRIRVAKKWPEVVDGRLCIHRLGGSSQLIPQQLKLYIRRDGTSSILIPSMAPRSRSKARPAPVVRSAPADEETIDLDDVSDASEEEDTPPAPTKARAVPTAGANAPGDETTRVAPIIKPVKKSNRALDIDLLFDRGKGKQSVCKFCK